jgi:hypothetical protein
MNSLKLLLPAVRLLLPKLIRQGLAALGGVMAGAGVIQNAGESSNALLVISGLLLWGFTALYSAWVKTPPTTEITLVVKNIIASLVSQGASFYSGWLSQQGFQGNPADAEAVTLFMANLGLSGLTRPAVKEDAKKTR